MGKNELRMVDGQKEADGAMNLNEKVNGLHLEGSATRFEKRCEELSLDERTSGQALELFDETESIFLSTTGSIGTAPIEDTERMWSACVLFAVKRLANGASVKEDDWKQTKGFTLSLILKVTKLSLLEFFKELPQFVAKAGSKLKPLYGAEWEKRLMVKEVQADFYYLTVLFNYYKRLCQSLFLSEDVRHGASSGLPSGGLGPSIHMRFGWMLFLVMRMRVLSRYVDLVTYINALLAVVIVMIVHMPPSLRKFSLDDESFFKKRGGDGNIQIIASLCALYEDASAEDVSKMVDKLNIMIGDLFRKNSGFRTRSHAEQLAGIDTEGLAYFEGLMDDRSIASSLQIVEDEYEEAYQCRGELDERMFINGDENIVGVVSSDTGTSSGTKRKSETISSQNQAPTTSTTGTYSSSPASTTSSPSKSTSAMTNIRMPPPTPVSVTMSTLKWLRTVISPLSPQPSPELQHFFRSCDHDISSEVNHRAQLLLNEIFSPDETRESRENNRGTKALLNHTWVEQRGLEARKLYYRVLTAMCKAESQRLSNDNLTALLTNERFHRCMITCAAELVLHTHKTVTMTFPAVLERTGITAFDLSKVIESYVRHEETLPRELKRHLNSMEQQILESMAWEKGSSLFNSLIVAKKNLAPVINGLVLLAEPMPAVGPSSGNGRVEPEGTIGVARVMSSPQGGPATLLSSTNCTPPLGNGLSDSRGSLLSPLKERPSAFSAFTSPVKNRPQPPLQSVFASPQRPSALGGGETCAETVIGVFFTKVLKLAAVRIKDLCERLHQSNQVWEQVYDTVKFILYKETSLFFNRHLDQMILCSVYGVCKVNKYNVTFRTCIEHYQRQPQCKRQVFCNVPLSSPSVISEGQGRSQETGDIIKFYNEIFVPATKQFLVHLGELIAAPATVNSRAREDKKEKDGSGPGSPKRSFPCLPDMSPKKVSPAHNVYVSPLRTAKMETLRSPHSRSLYACVGESTQAYQSPSKDLTAINNRLNRRLGKLDFNGASMVSDSLVAGNLYGCNRTANSTRLTSDSILSGQSQPSWAMVAPLPPSPMKRPRNDR